MNWGTWGIRRVKTAGEREEKEGGGGKQQHAHQLAVGHYELGHLGGQARRDRKE